METNSSAKLAGKDPAQTSQDPGLGLYAISSNPQRDEELRILVVTPWGAGGGYGGPVVLMNRLFQAVDADPAITIDLLYRDRGREESPQWATSSTPLRLGTRGALTRRDQFAWVRAVRRFLRRQGDPYDFVHLHGAYVMNCLAVMSARRRRFRYCLLPVSQGDLALPKKRLWYLAKRAIVRQVISRASVGFALSNEIMGQMLECGLTKSRTVLLPNVASPGEFSRAAPLAPPKGPVRLGFVGKLGPRKQPILLLEAVDLLRKDGIEASACFVGPFDSKAYEDFFRHEVRRLGLSDRIKLTGFRKNVTSFLHSEMDIFVLPSKSEGLPGALVEAMMAGLPCIVSDAGSMRFHVESSGAGYVVPANATAIAGAVVKVLSSSTTWTRLSLNATGYAKSTFDTDVVAKRYIAALRLAELA